VPTKLTESLPTAEPEYLDIVGVTRLLSSSLRQVQRLLSAGRLPPPDLNISGTGGPKGKRWRRDHLMEWLDARRP
jgi:hypothetical protein